MIGLLKKDLLILRRGYMKNFFLVLVLYTVLGIALKMTSFFTLMSWMYGFYVVSLFSVDNACRWDFYAATLPVSRKAVVTAKFLLLGLWIHLFPHQRQEGQAKAAGHQDQTDEHRDEIVFAALRLFGIVQHLAPQQNEACCRNDLQHQQRVKIRREVISKEKYPRSNQANAQRHTAHPPDRLCLCGGRRRIFRDPARFRGGIRCRFLSVLDNFC